VLLFIVNGRLVALRVRFGLGGQAKSGPRPSLPCVILCVGWAGPDLASGSIAI
jgi:hypothetical protein